ncbi:hypothetical protein FB567DRAFT_554817 [Paraphoma chrysanthemicola]|uniref:Uncharacterized protein n=1 Tax=Paraphoma chrysanthemicola TaxID=798071 RepID=A0A8K0QVK6_9PLEO|nr:hypothetical protein FB567DRAFT_554817 [Paraphoma chrysanthemicola]
MQREFQRTRVKIHRRSGSPIAKRIAQQRPAASLENETIGHHTLEPMLLPAGGDKSRARRVFSFSFASAIGHLSSNMPREHQGFVASLVVPAVYCISIGLGLGLGGTVDSQVRGGGRDVLQGYIGILYLATGPPGLEICISTMYRLVSFKVQVITEEKSASGLGPRLSIPRAIYKQDGKKGKENHEPREATFSSASNPHEPYIRAR